MDINAVLPGYRRLRDQFRALQQKLQQAEAEGIQFQQKLREAEAESIQFQQKLQEVEAESIQFQQKLQELDAEKIQFKQRLEEVEAENVQLRARPLTWAPPGHFYSPTIDPHDPFVNRMILAGGGEGPKGEDLQLDDALMLRWLDRIASHYPEYCFPEEKQADYRFYSLNPAFDLTDAVVLFGFLTDLKPARVIEVGSGYSSCLCMDTNDRYLGGRTELTFVEPYPEVLLSLLDESDPYRRNIAQVCLQDAPLDWFTTLEAGDILIIDSSHVVKTCSDVNDYLFRILPALKPGVIIHVHDIFYPFEYGADWIIDENRSWNEAYILRAFLQYNRAFQVIYFNHYMSRQFHPLIESKMPRCSGRSGGSIWLEKIGNGAGGK